MSDNNLTKDDLFIVSNSPPIIVTTLGFVNPYSFEYFREAKKDKSYGSVLYSYNIKVSNKMIKKVNNLKKIKNIKVSNRKIKKVNNLKKIKNISDMLIDNPMMIDKIIRSRIYSLYKDIIQINTVMENLSMNKKDIDDISVNYDSIDNFCKDILNLHYRNCIIDDKICYIFGYNVINGMNLGSTTFPGLWKRETKDSYELKRYVKSFSRMKLLFNSNKDAKRFKELLENNVHPLLIALYFNSKSVSDNKEKYYREFSIPKNNGKIRIIREPNQLLKVPLRNIGKTLDRIHFNEDNDILHAYTSKHSIITNADIHKDNKYIITMDITDYFPSIDWKDIKKHINFLYGRLKDDEDLIRFTKKAFVDCNNKLYIGNPASGSISNIIFYEPINNIVANTLDKKDIKVSAYADDLTFSCDYKIKEFNSKYLKRLCLFAFKRYGLNLKINDAKTHFMYNERRKITGIRINHEDKKTIPRNEYLKLRSILNYIVNGKEVDIEMSSLSGLISYYISIDDTYKVVKMVNKLPKPLINKLSISCGRKFYEIPDKYRYNIRESGYGKC